MRIRPVRPEEHATLGSVTVAGYESLGRALGDYADELRDVRGRAEGALVLVAVDDDDRILGGVTYVPGPESPYAEDLRAGEAGVRMLAVDPAVHGRGIGGRLVDRCIDMARREQRRRLCLHSTPEMTVAHGIYERRGFVREPERDWPVDRDLVLLAFALDLRGATVAASPGGETGSTREA